MHRSVAFAALVPLGLALGPSTPQQGPQKAPFDTNAAACGTCHVSIYEEWKESLHSHAWTSETYQGWCKTKRNPEKTCHKCHIPQSVIPSAPKRPKTREHALDEGVGCSTCHVHDGKVHGPHGTATDAHPTVKSELFGTGGVGLCQSCHRIVPKPVISIGKDFEKYVNVHKDASCKGCHMPEQLAHGAIDPETGKPAGEKRQIRSHRFAGRTDPKMIAKAFEFHRDKKDGKLVLRLENKAGHRLPGLTLRSYTVKFEVLGQGGRVLATRDARITTKSKETLRELSSLTVEVDEPPGTELARVTVNHWFQRTKKDEPKDQGIVFRAEK